MSDNSLLILAIAAATYYFLSRDTTTEKFTDIQTNSLVKLGSNWTFPKGIPGGLLAITASWCGYCTKLKKNVTDAGLKNVFYFDASNSNDPQVENLLQAMNISSFPTVFKIGQDGLLIPYDGSREVVDLKQNFS
jgi:thiol:disulfide interchange protein